MQRLNCWYVGVLCAWSLWSQTVTGGGQANVQSFWDLISAYPDSGYSECMASAKNSAENLARVDTSASSAVKRARLVTPHQDALLYTGKAHQVMTDYKDGRSDVTAFRCFPDTINPKEGK